jgi:ribosomal protein L40E
MGYNDYDKASFVLAFVQHLPYMSDLATTGYDEYPRFPIETLVDNGGDCEDVAVLFASLMLIMGYGVVYINPPNHYAVGILGDNLKGTYWTYPKDSNQTYYYCETTGVNFKIGQLPQEFSGKKVHIYPIDEGTQFVPPIATMQPTVQPMPTQTVAPSFNPNPTDASVPGVPDPVAQPVLPLSFDLIVENPVLFASIVLAIAASIGTTVMTTRKPRRISQPSTAITDPLNSQPAENNQNEEIICLSCGATNKGYAVFCEKCGKHITN